MKKRQQSPEKVTIFTPFVLLFLPCILLLAIILAFFTTQAINRDMIALQSGSAFHLESGATAIQREIAMVVSDLAYLKTNPELQNYFQGRDGKFLAQAGSRLQHFSAARKCYDQIRFINKNGMEAIRVNFDHDLHTLAPPEKLQDKAKRYYFTDTLRLQTDEIYVSPLDLNMEHDKVEEPYKPMLRFGVVLVDQQGQKQGIIVLNYRARLLLSQYKEALHSSIATGSHSHFLGNAMLLNKEGYWLLSPNPADEWGFMLGRQTTMAQKQPKAWTEIQSKHSGSIVTSNGYFAFTTVYPLRAQHVSSSGTNARAAVNEEALFNNDYAWKLVSHIPPSKLQTINSLTHRFPWLLFICLTLISMPLFWALAWSRRHQQAIARNLELREEQYRLLYQLAPMAYQSLDEDGHIVDINKEWLHTLGYDANEVKGRPFSDFILPEQRDEFHSRFAEFKGRGKMSNLLLRLQHKLGDEVLASFSGLVIRDEDGNFQRTQSVFQDVTRQHQAHSELTANLALLETIINTIPSIICLKDDKGRWLLANRLYLEICGLQEVKYQGKSDDELAWHSARLHEELLTSKQEDLMAWEQGTALRQEKIIRLPDDRGEAIFDIVRQPSFCDGRRINLLLVGFDITDRKKNEEFVRLNQMRYQALCQLHQLEDQDISSLHAYALEAAGRLSESKLAYLHCFGGPDQPASFSTWSASGPIGCQGPEGKGHNPEAQAIWQECLGSRQAVIHNNYPALEQRHGLPLDHLPIIHHMSAPLLDGDTVIGVLGVANKDRPYTSDDAEQLFLFTVNIVAIFRQRQFSQALEKSQAEWLRTFDAISDVVTIQDTAMHITQINKAGTILLEAPREEIIGKKCYEVFHGSQSVCPGCPIEANPNSFTPYTGEVFHEKLAKTFLVSASPIRDRQNNVTGIAHFAKDISATKQLEEQLRQAQKMEAVGTLAGGVAHDFNNILTAVSGYLELAMMKTDAEASSFSDLLEVQKAANRAADLVRQLMLFSRKKSLQPVVLDINTTVQDILKMLSRLIGEDIIIETDLHPDLWQVMADVGNLEQVLTNLALNGRDAMPEGGMLTLHTANREISQQDIPVGSQILPGRYVMLSVEDSGIGMDTAVRDHLFEPFFTTKEPGKGTGLGLSVVYGIIREHKGWIEVDSSPGKGTVFRLYLPALSPDSSTVRPEQERIRLNQITGHGERILLVEDEVMLNEFAFKALSRHGYQVSATYNAEEALAIWDREGGDFDLVFSDVVLPGKNGLQLIEELRSRKPLLKTLLTSGYTDKKSQAAHIKEKHIPFLAKPYDILTVLKKISEALASR